MTGRMFFPSPLALWIATQYVLIFVFTMWVWPFFVYLPLQFGLLGNAHAVNQWGITLLVGMVLAYLIPSEKGPDGRWTPTSTRLPYMGIWILLGLVASVILSPIVLG